MQEHQAAATGARSSNVRFLNVISTKRSGHHALIKWVEDGSRQPTCFINNAPINDAFLARISDLVAKASEPTTVILNYEGVSVAGVHKILAHQRTLGAPQHNMLFARDPLNACASLMQRKAAVYAQLVMILRQLFALSDWLRRYQAGDSGLDLVFYNRWLADENYRQTIADRLAIQNKPVRSEITKFGGGSSFQDAQGGSAAAPRLLSRWTSYKDDPLFRTMVGHPRFVDIFLAEVNGTITDAGGESDYGQDRAAYLESLRGQPPASAYANRMINGLSRNTRAYQDIEALKGGLHKRALILKAHVGALLNGGA
jgi:hypothetical protein